MTTDVGVLNPNSVTKEYMRDLRQAAVSVPAAFTIEGFAEKIASRYEAALTLLTTGVNTMIAKGERLCAEYETQLTLLAEYADMTAEG